MNENFEFKIWIDGQNYSKDKIPNYMESYFKPVNDGLSLKLESVGIHFHHDKLNIMLPKNTNENMFDSEKHINLLIRGLTDNRLSYSSSYNEFATVKTSDFFEVIKWLINDFKKNGIFLNSSTYTNKKRGKLNWKKTIKNVRPFLNGNNLEIMEFFKDKKIHDLDEISLLHIHVISMISKKYGSLFQGFIFNGNNIKMNLRESKRIERLLKHAITISNNNREIYLFKNLLIYLQLIQSNNDNVSISTKSFHIFFENMCKWYKNHDQELMKYIPSAKWNFKLPEEQDTRYAENNQIPDVLVNNSGKLDIYDAKYYDLTYLKTIKALNSVPLDWYSVSKQFFYALSFNYEKSGLKKGDNYFIFPYPNSKLELIKIGDITINDNVNEQQNINIMLIDTLKLLEFFLDSK